MLCLRTGLPDWVVDRPAEAAQVGGALLRHGAGTVSITTALQGAGGFGKTTLARVVCADPRVRHRFNGGVYLVTVGRDARGAAAMATKLNDVIKLVSGEDATFTDPEIAGRRLAALLDTGPRRLLVLDDVWEPRQLAPFVAGGRRCARLVTTRDPGLLTGRGIAVRVDQMSLEQARALLASGLAHLDASVADELLAVTGRWPLLLGLVNKILVNARRAGNDVDAAGNMLLQRLYAAGPAVVDHILGAAPPFGRGPARRTSTSGAGDNRCQHQSAGPGRQTAVHRARRLRRGRSHSVRLARPAIARRPA